MKVTRKIIEIDEEKCDGCGNCVPACAEGAIQIIDGIAKVIADKYCDGLGACLGDCPQGALTLIEREADEFDEDAVEELLKQQKAEAEAVQAPKTGGCPSAAVKTFENVGCGCESGNHTHLKPFATAKGPAAGPGPGSALGHWPVQIKLVPAGAPFLKGADLLVAADCVPVAYSSFHQDFLKGRAVMIGCPKFDDAEAYVDKFTDVFNESGIKSLTVVVMEVPCCSGLPVIVQKALERSGKNIPVRTVVVSARGELLGEQALG